MNKKQLAVSLRGGDSQLFLRLIELCNSQALAALGHIRVVRRALGIVGAAVRLVLAPKRSEAP